MSKSCESMMKCHTIRDLVTSCIGISRFHSFV